MTVKKTFKRVLRVILVLFVCVNIIAFNHAWKFTHYSKNGVKTDSMHLTFAKKVQLLFTGVDNPRPQNNRLPDWPYTTVTLKSNVTLECWLIPAAGKAKGTVILFHGYTACKSQELDRAEPLIRDGYNCLLVDFMGSGGSAANSTTVGFKEAEEVKDCFEYIKNTGEHNVFLYGSSMGAVAIMKAINDYNIAPDAIIIDCPFGTMYETVAIRFRNLGVPPVPMAAILLFLGGLQNGFWGFSHNPESYAKNVHCPVLLQYGAKDDRVTRGEIDRIYANLGGRKRLVIYPLSGHDDYLVKNGTEWCGHVLGYLSSCPGGSAVR